MASGNSEIGESMNRPSDNVTLMGFKLEPIQLIVAKKIIANHLKKIREASNYKQLRIRLKKHNRGKRFLYEIDAESIITENKNTNPESGEGRNIKLSAAVTSYDFNAALTEVMEKIFFEALHKSRTSKETGLNIKKSQNK